MSDQVTRGPLLTAYLVLLSLSAIVGVGSFPFLWHDLSAQYPTWALIYMVVSGVLRILALVALWLWSRWGLVAYVALTIVAVPVLTSIGGKMFLFGIVGSLLLVILVWPKWKHMSWGFSVHSVVQNGA